MSLDTSENIKHQDQQTCFETSRCCLYS